MIGLMTFSESHRNAFQRHTLVVILILSLAGCAGMGDQFEKSRYQAGEVCPELVGVWYNDFTVQTKSDGPARHINQIQRAADGTGYLKGITFYDAGTDVRLWEFPMTWRCDGEWYTEKNEWGYTSFKIKSVGKNIVYIDERYNLGTEPYIVIDFDVYAPPNEKIREYFGL